MHKLLAIGLSLLLLAACGTQGIFGGAFDMSSELDDPAPAPAMDTRGLAVYLDLMRKLVEGDAVTQAETYAGVAYAAEVSPTTTNRLKLALAHAVPSHASTDASRAAEQLNRLLAQGDALLPEERALARIHLEEVEQRLILDTAAEQLRREAEDAQARQNAEQAERLESALAENQRLRAELEDAQEKLDAITSIEQSIRERENDAN